VNSNPAKTLSEWNGSYAKRLTPFLILSLVIHMAGFGILLGASIFFAGGKGVKVLAYLPGNIQNKQDIRAGWRIPASRSRPKVYRIDFFNKVIPWIPPPPEVLPSSSVEPEPEVKESEKPKAPEKPKENKNLKAPVKPKNPEEKKEPKNTSTPAEPEKPSANGAGESAGQPSNVPDGRSPVEPELSTGPESPLSSEGYTGPVGPSPLVAQPVLPNNFLFDKRPHDAYGAFPPTDSAGNVGDAHPMPNWAMPDLDGVNWQASQFWGNYTIYILGDISRRHGFEDLLAWDWTLRQLVTNPNAAWPPNVVTIASTIENPYGYSDALVADELQLVKKQESLFGVILPDRAGTIARSLGYFELPQPIVIFVDQNGYIRMVLIGRVIDISGKNIAQSMDTIADMWQWTPEERKTLPAFVEGMVNYLKQKAYDSELRRVPPSDEARQKAVDWSYPTPPPPT
jgi:hypothetical protein